MLRAKHMYYDKNAHEPDRPSGYYVELVIRIAKTSASLSLGNYGSFAQS